MISGVGIAEGAHGIDIELEPPLIDPEDHLRRLAESGTDLIVVGSDFDSSVGLGASTSSAVLITDSPVVPDCILRPFGAGGGDPFPLMIVSPP